MRSYKTWTTVLPIWTTSWSLAILQEHDHHICTLFTQLQTYGILLNPSKCVLCVPEISFLGYKISFLGSQASPGTSRRSSRLSHSQDRHQFRRFLEIPNFYWHFLLHTASIQTPLHDALFGTRFNCSHTITWTAGLITASDDCKASLARAALLAHRHETTPLALVTDASTTSISAVL